MQRLGTRSVTGTLGSLLLAAMFAACGSSAAQPTLTTTPTDRQTPQAPTPSPLPSFTPWATPTPSPTPLLAPPLPTVVAAIGDSYTQAWTVSSKYKYDHPQFSWAVGDEKGDGVFSLLERFQALGDNPIVVDAATSGKKMSDAVRQAREVVANAQDLPAGGTVFVAFELGTNDLCDTPWTDTQAFETQLRAAAAVLEAGLPPGSRILMLSVPDFNHFRAITQADPTARAAYTLVTNSKRCPPFLGWDAPYSLDQAKAQLIAYNSILYKVCDEIQANDGPSGKLYCHHDEANLSERDFKIADLSRADYFHPSITGQARMAAAAWQASWWISLPLPANASY